MNKYPSLFLYFNIIFLLVSVGICFDRLDTVEWWKIVVLIPLFYVFVDFISGLLHIVLDNEKFLDWEQTIKPYAQGFQSHHESPRSICEMSLFDHLIVLHVPLFFMYGWIWIVNNVYIHFTYVYIFLLLHLMQMSHRWAHSPRKSLNRLIVKAQDFGLLLPARDHQVHHRSPYAVNFCILNGICNPLLNKITANYFSQKSEWWLLVFLISCHLPVIFASFL